MLENTVEHIRNEFTITEVGMRAVLEIVDGGDRRSKQREGDQQTMDYQSAGAGSNIRGEHLDNRSSYCAQAN